MKRICVAVRQTAPRPIFFCCHLGADGRPRFNFRLVLPRGERRTVSLGSEPFAVLAMTLLLRSHPEWFRQLGRTDALVQARRLAPALAGEYLIPHAGRAWIISSSTVREFVADQLVTPLPRVPSVTRASRAMRMPAMEATVGSP